MPRSIIEAMASGKPVVATNIRGCREEVVRGVTGIIVPLRDSDALYQAFVRILSDPRLARRMGNEGRRRAEELYDERNVLEREVQVYVRLAEEKLHQDAFAKSPAQAGAQHEESRGVGEP
jgi:glycosyltransferase involved in cell wall biosynthesis